MEKKKDAGILAEIWKKKKKGRLIKGKTAYGCTDYKAGCAFVLPYTFADKKISENQYLRLLQKGSTVNLKDFKIDSGSVEGLLRFDENFKLVLETKKTASKAIPDELTCPKCKKGTILKGKMAYGCGNYKLGCDFKVTFDIVREKLKDQKPTKELVHAILKESFLKLWVISYELYCMCFMTHQGVRV